MSESMHHCMSQRIIWSKTGSGEFPYEATVLQAYWRIRINDFPAEPMYTLLIDGDTVGSFNDWPPHWQRG